ncbi:MAG: hypothetical protein WC900_03860, partial [Oscillospiraceae bacterium]
MAVYEKKVKLTSREKITVILSVILIVISILAVIFVFLWNWKPFDNQKGEIYVPPENSEGEPVEEVTEKQINFLIVGLDESELL